jgi:hypothetical protein
VSDELAAEKTQEPRTPRKNRIVLLATIAVVALLGLVVIVQLVLRPAVRTQEAANAEAVDTRGLERVAWCGAGRFAVVQDFERDGTPVVTAWNRDSGRTESRRGWLWLRTEQAASAIWMLPMSGKEVAALVAQPGRTPYPLAGVASFDAPAPELVRWVLDSVATPVPATTWEPLPGSIGTVAVASVEQTIGSAPASLSFVLPGHNVQRATIRVGASSKTFDVLGWSASRAVFGIRGIAQVGPQPSHFGAPSLAFYAADGTQIDTGNEFEFFREACWSGQGSWVVTIEPATGGNSVTARALVGSTRPTRELCELRVEEEPVALLGPAGRWVLIGVSADKGARQYDEITAPGERKRVLLIPRDPSAEWTQESWHEGAGLLRLGLSTSATGQLQTRVLLYRPGVSRPKTVYKGSKRLTTEGDR